MHDNLVWCSWELRGPGGHQQAPVVDQTGPKPSSYSQLFRPRAPVECLKLVRFPDWQRVILGAAVVWGQKCFGILRHWEVQMLKRLELKCYQKISMEGAENMKSGTCTYTNVFSPLCVWFCHYQCHQKHQQSHCPGLIPSTSAMICSARRSLDIRSGRARAGGGRWTVLFPDHHLIIVGTSSDYCLIIIIV